MIDEMRVSIGILWYNRNLSNENPVAALLYKLIIGTSIGLTEDF